jgi:hypothetical protein
MPHLETDTEAALLGFIATTVRLILQGKLKIPALKAAPEGAPPQLDRKPGQRLGH